MALNLQAIIPVEIPLAKVFAPNFLSTFGQQKLVRPSNILAKNIVSPFLTTDFSATNSFFSDCIDYQNGDMILDHEKDISTPDGDFSAKCDVALIGYMLSSYYKTNRAAVQTVTKFRLNVTESTNIIVPIEFYCLKNYSLKSDDIDIISDQDMIHGSVLGLNMCVNAMRSKGMAAMHPLSRTTVSEEGLSSFKDFMETDSRMKKYQNLGMNRKVTAVKLFNTACTRKSHQFFGDTNFYCPELAAATLISGIMGTKKVSTGLINIANGALKKIARTAGTLDQNLVVDLMGFTISGGTAIDAEQVFQAYKNKSANGFNVPMQASPNALKSFQEKPGSTKN